MKWFTVWWWRYVVESAMKPPEDRSVSRWTAFVCRLRGHDGVWWYSMGDEPDMHCRRCGDDLG